MKNSTVKNSTANTSTGENPSSSTDRSPQKNRWLVGIGIIGTVGLVAIALQSFLAQRTFEQAIIAYESGDCTTAISQFDRVLYQWRVVDFSDRAAQSEAKKVECQAFQTGVTQQQQNNHAAALDRYANFLRRYPTSPLRQPLANQIDQLFQAAQPAALAQINVCDQLEVLTQQDILPQPEQTLPQFYQACGETYTKQSNYAAAIASYEQLLQQYPKHALAPDAQSKLAQVTVTAAQQTGAGTIDQPAQIGRTGFGSSVVAIRNDSPKPIQIVFSGPQPRFEEIEPCLDCQVFNDGPPSSCPEKGTIKEFTLEPGQYNVVVKSNQDGATQPFVGEWTLENGAVYGNCFFIVQQTIPGS